MTARRALASLTLAALAYSVMQMMVVPALPAIQRDLDTGPAGAAWLVSAFLLSTAVGTPLLGRLGDLHGQRRALIAVLALFALGGLLGALARSLPQLIAARVLQGLGGAVFPLAYGVARSVLPPARVPVAIGAISGSFGIGGSIGLVASGPLVDGLSWHWLFWLGSALPLVAIGCVAAFVPAGREPAARRPLDRLGAVLLTGGLLALLIAVAQARAWGLASARLLLLAAAAPALLAAWWRWELRLCRARERPPLIDVELLRRRAIWPANAIGVLVGFGMYVTGFLVPQLALADPADGDIGLGMGVSGASLVLLPALLAGLAAGTAAGELARRRGERLPLALGTATMALGYVVLAGAHGSPWSVALGALLTHGIGLNFALASMANAVVAAAPSGQTGEAAGMNTMLRTVGGAFGGQCAAAVLAATALGGGALSSRGFTLAFALCAALLALAWALTRALAGGAATGGTARRDGAAAGGAARGDGAATGGAARGDGAREPGGAARGDGARARGGRPPARPPGSSRLSTVFSFRSTVPRRSRR